MVGCRAIMKDIVEVDTLVNIINITVVGININFTKNILYHDPKESGYRGIHLVYKYHSDQSKDYDDMKIEIQIALSFSTLGQQRLKLFGTFIKQSLKSSQGERDWLRFLCPMSSAMAITEGKQRYQIPLLIRRIKERIARLSAKLEVRGHLTAYKNSIRVLGGRHTTTGLIIILNLTQYWAS